MPRDWRDKLAGARMQVDQTFRPRVDESSFSSQEWGLIMTAVEFDIETPEEPAAARMVARTDRLAGIMPELKRIRSQMGGPTPGGGSGGGIGDRLRNIVGSLFGSASTGSSERLDEAETLVQDYAAALQSKLEEQGRWEAVCEAAAEQI